MTWEPKILGLLCNWCSYLGADLAGTSRMKYAPNVRIVRLMCSGRADPSLVLSAFKNGADGVLIAGCHPGDCHYQTGNLKARRRIALLRSVMETLGLDQERVWLRWISASEGRLFAETIREYDGALQSQGKNPLADEWDL